MVWDAGLVLAQYIADNAELIRGKRVLELGSGTGLVGLAALQLGAAAVTLTDMQPLLPLLRSNLHANASDTNNRIGIAASGGARRTGADGDTCCAGHGTVTSKGNSQRGVCDVKQLTWEVKNVQQSGFAALERLVPFDVVLGGDIVYEQGEDERCILVRHLVRSRSDACRPFVTGGGVHGLITTIRKCIEDLPQSRNMSITGKSAVPTGSSKGRAIFSIKLRSGRIPLELTHVWKSRLLLCMSYGISNSSADYSLF